MKRKINGARIILGVCILLLLGAMATTFIMARKFMKANRMAVEGGQKYSCKYAFIPSDNDDVFINEVYESARVRAEENNIYVDLMGDELVNSYNAHELMRMAIATKPAGIIVEADDSEEMTELINTAVDKGIPVVTYMTDTQNSGRQCFVGTNFYVLGLKYGEAAIETNVLENSTEEEPGNILVLVKDSLSENNVNSFYSSVVSALSNMHPYNFFNITVDSVDTSSTFSVEEAVRDIMLDREQDIDVIMCLDEITTTCLYQALVDYNRVGDMSVIGNYNSESILQGVKRNVLQATIIIDADAMGASCVDALNEYRESGYVSDYMSVQIETVTGNNVDKFLN